MTTLPLMEIWPTSSQRSFAAPAATQSVAAAPDPAKLPTVQLRHRVAFPGADTIQSVDISPDGRVAYCAVVGRSVDLWAATVSTWPDLLGTLVAFSVAAWLLMVIRVKRRAQIPGEPHCRRCNYNVKAQTPDCVKPRRERVPPTPGVKCPECGTELLRKPPRRGRSTVHRLWPVTAAMVLITGGYLTLWAFGVARNGPVSAAGWFSSWVDEQAERRQIAWLLKQRCRVLRIMKVDTASGSIIGTLCTIAAELRSELRVSPDGGFLVFVDTQDCIRWMSLRDGSIAASIVTKGTRVTAGVGSRAIVGFDRDPNAPGVYFTAADGRRKVNQLIRWQPGASELRVVVEEPWYGPDYLPRKYALLNWPNGTATLAASDILQAVEQNVHKWTIRAPMSDGGSTIRVIDNVGVDTIPYAIEATPDGSAVFVPTRTPDIKEFDPKTGALLGVLMIPDTPNPHIRVSPDGSKLIVPLQNGSIMVRDLRRQSWVGTATFPIRFGLRSIGTSADGRRLAACAYEPMQIKAPRTQPYSYELFLFDLSPLDQLSGTK